MGALHFVPANEDFARFEALYIRAFPENERRPLSDLRTRFGHHLTMLSIRDGETFVGLMMLLETGDIAHIIYFAIEDALRGHGLGARALALLSEEKQGMRILADLERGDSDSMRIRRRGFYARNGFAPTEVEYRWQEEDYIIYCYGGDLPRTDYDAFWDNLLPDYANTLSSARAFSQAGKLDTWIHLYLNSDGKNKPFSDGLKLCKRCFAGPVMMPAKLFTRNTGPEEGMTYRTDAEDFRRYVQTLAEHIQNDPDMPPLIVHYVDHGFELNDGNHRLEAYRRLGTTEVPVILWTTEVAEYEELATCYPEYLKDADMIRA